MHRIVWRTWASAPKGSWKCSVIATPGARTGTCRSSVKHMFEQEEKWHCGCCGAPFRIHPVMEDIPHYLKLVELGGKK
ncbi:MAG: hypothetical protein K1W23_05780 [Lachnospiraceae bacterium]